MRYVDFRASIKHELQQAGALTWKELRDRLKLPYERPCPEWVRQLESDIGLRRERGAGRAYVWSVDGTG